MSNLQPGAFRDHARAVEEAPFVCEHCGRATDELITSESADPSVGYKDAMDLCPDCDEAFQRRKQ